MQRNRWIGWLLVAVVTVMMTACGGGGGGPSAADQAVATFRAYAQNPATADVPDADDYDTLDVALQGHTIDEINAYIAQLGNPDAVDSKAELDDIAAAIGVTILDTDDDGTYNAFDTDDDGDGVSDVDEAAAGSDPLDANSTAHNGLVYNVITSDDTGRQWLDRNLGATKVCDKSRDDGSFANDAAYENDQQECFGDYYQWGRKTNGHEKAGSMTSTDQLAQDVESGGKFIKGHADWRTTPDDLLWRGSDAPNAICPAGFEVPTIEELDADTLLATGDNKVTNRDTAFKNFLHLPASGYRNSNGDKKDLSKIGALLSSSAANGISYIYYRDGDASEHYDTESRAFGVQVRCIKSIPVPDESELPTVLDIIKSLSTVMVIFSEPMKRDTLTKANITLYKKGTDVAIDFNLTETGHRVILEPLVKLRYGTDYVVALSTSIQDQHDNSMAGSDTNGVTDAVSHNREFTTRNYIWHKSIRYKVVTSPYGEHKQWLDRNIGATRVCTKSRDDGFADDAAYVSSQKGCFGDYYQWGRGTDGHEVWDSQGTADQANDVNNAGNKFITEDGSFGLDWAQAADTNGDIRKANWSKTDGTSVCPVGFRVPSEAEVNSELFEVGSATIANRNDAFLSFLKLPANGYRDAPTGNIETHGKQGCMWTRTTNDLESSYSCFSDSTAVMFTDPTRAYGSSVRCIRAE